MSIHGLHSYQNYRTKPVKSWFQSNWVWTKRQVQGQRFEIREKSANIEKNYKQTRKPERFSSDCRRQTFRQLTSAGFPLFTHGGINYPPAGEPDNQMAQTVRPEACGTFFQTEITLNNCMLSYEKTGSRYKIRDTRRMRKIFIKRKKCSMLPLFPLIHIQRSTFHHSLKRMVPLSLQRGNVLHTSFL